MIAAALRRIRSLGGTSNTSTSLTRAPVATFPSDAERIRVTGKFTLEDIDLIVRTISQHDIVHGSPWDDFRTANLVLPDWFDHGLDPNSTEYAQQQHDLWRALAGREQPYDPERDEKEAPLADVDAVRRPAYYMRRDTEALRLAADQIIATGMILKHCGLKPGDRTLEYGAGFGQTALTLARLGVIVDTVDISACFCEYVRSQAEFFRAPLTAFEGRFGSNPRGDAKYDLILFFEAFHHCPDFRSIVQDIKRHLAPGGRVLLMGEPILRGTNRYLPYPWGLRLDAEPIAQVRRFGWFELGFTEEFILRLFTDAGFVARRIDCPPSIHGSGYIFKPRTEKLLLSEQWFPDDIDAGWNNPEEHGRWTKGDARLSLDTTDNFRCLEIDAQNHHPFSQQVEFRYGASVTTANFKTGERKTVVIDAARKAPDLRIRTRARVPADRYMLRTPDTRSLGILVRSVSYRS
jgi:SAM-dependent methyltransferase